jgi:hypothetical protein
VCKTASGGELLSESADSPPGGSDALGLVPRRVWHFQSALLWHFQSALTAHPRLAIPCRLSDTLDSAGCASAGLGTSTSVPKRQLTPMPETAGAGGKLGTWLARKGPWLALGMVTGLLVLPLLFTLSKYIKAIANLAVTAPTTWALASTIYEQFPWAAVLVLVLCSAIALVFSRDDGPRNINWLWGLYKIQIPDALREAAEARQESRRVEAKAAEIVEDFAGVMSLIQDASLRPSPQRKQAVLEEICEMASRALYQGHTLHCSLWRPLPDKPTVLHIVAAYRVPLPTIETMVLESGKGLAGTVFQSTRPKVIANTKDVSDDEYAPDPARGRAAMTIMGLPIYSAKESKPTGVLCFSQVVERGAKSFTAEDLVRAQPYKILMELALSSIEVGELLVKASTT